MSPVEEQKQRTEGAANNFRVTNVTFRMKQIKEEDGSISEEETEK